MRILLTALLTVCILISGCSKDKEPKKPASVSQQQHAGKKSAPFSVEFKTPKKADPGDTIIVTVTLTALQNCTDFTLLAGGKGVDILTGETLLTKAVLSKGETVTADIQAVLQNEGINYVGINASALFGTQRLPYIINTPISTGLNPEKAFLEKSSASETDHSGRKIRKMKATENSNQ